MKRWLLTQWRRWKGMPPQPAAEWDWQAGDRGCCIARGTWIEAFTLDPSVGPALGKTYRVRAVFADKNGVWLVFVEFGRMAYPAGYFRKLRACDAKFAQVIRERRPAPKPRVDA